MPVFDHALVPTVARFDDAEGLFLIADVEDVFQGERFEK